MVIAIIQVIFFLSAFVIFWAMVGYPVSLLILDKIIKRDDIQLENKYYPSVTLLIVAHNEEKVIREKLENAISLEYPEGLIEILVTSDNSTDRTNEIVNDYILANPKINLRLFEVKERKGKTNAQNEAVVTIESEIIVMTDANAMLEKRAIKHLVTSFGSEDIAYVTGRLVYINQNDSWTSASESTYWNLDLRMREIESKIKTITGGNGALYAVRRIDYFNFDPMHCHDGAMPKYFASLGKRAIFNKDALAYEKAGESIEDEFSRKVRMNRNITKGLIKDIKYINFYRYGWFSYFYFGHRVCRRLLWFSHSFLLITNFLLFNQNIFYAIALFSQILFFSLSLIRKCFRINNRVLNMFYYYFVTIIAQFIGVYNNFSGKAKPIWDKADTTR